MHRAQGTTQSDAVPNSTAASRESEGGLLIHTRDDLRTIDRLADERYGLSTSVLMESAGRGIARIAERMARRSSAGGPAWAAVDAGARRVELVCGGGNNGGDGFVAARHLQSAGRTARVVLCADPERLRGAALTNWKALDASQRVLAPDPASIKATLGSAATEPELRPALVIDCLAGTGLARVPDGLLRAGIKLVNAWAALGVDVLAADLPSGLDADTGEPIDAGACVRADVTASICGLKQGFLAPASGRWTGLIEQVEIGVPAPLLAENGRLVRLPCHLRERLSGPRPVRRISNSASRRAE